jgi:hypothetical protein
MKSSKKVWLTGSVLAAVAAIVAVLAIPVGASAKVSRPATTTPILCAAHNDAVVDVSQFAEDAFTVDAVGPKCTVTESFSYTPGKLAAPVTVATKVTVDANGAFSGDFANKLVSGHFSGQLTNPTGTTGGTWKVKIRAGVDFKPLTAYIEVEIDKKKAAA